VRRPEDLQSLTLVRGGETRNVTALLRTRACLLVIDDAKLALPTPRLAELCGPRSRIILTQRTVQPGSYELPMLTRPEAQSLLDHEGATCPPAAFEIIWSKVGGHPLSLGLIGAAVRQGATWAEIVLDCQAVGELEHDGQRLADRLLGRLRPALERELSVFAWVEQPNCGQDFLEHVIQPLGIRKLRGHGLTAADRSGVVRLHDVVFAALNGEWCSPERRVELDAALETYLLTTASETGLRFWTIGRILRPKIEKLVAEEARPAAFRYALLSVWDHGELRPELVGDPLADAKALVGSPPAPLAVIAVVEAIEQLGGAVAAIEARFMQEEIEASAYTYAKAVDDAEKVVVGVNTFVEEEHQPTEVFPIDVELQRNQIARVARVRAERDQAAVEAALADVAAAARGTQNLLVPMKSALAAMATLGEVSDVLRAEFGVYQPGS